MSLLIDDILVPDEAGGFTQEYQLLSAASRYRMGDGSLRETIAWSGKLRTVIRGHGWAPSGIEGIDYGQDVVIKCAAPRVISSTSNVITIPSARRSDTGHTPTATAIVAGQLVATTISLVGDVATLGVVSGASVYRVQYYPQIIARAVLDDQGTDTGAATHSWSLTAEEI